MKKIFTLLLFLFMPLFVMVGQDPKEIKINETQGNITLPDENGATSYMIIGEANQSTTNTITVKKGSELDITLENVEIDVSEKNDACAFLIEVGAKVNLTLEGTNELYSGDGRAGLEVPKGATLKIIGGSGSLNVMGGDKGSGIGGGNEGDSGKITISGGTVEATGNNGGAGIGGGNKGDSGKITISGGTVEATGNNGGSDIGGGNNGKGGTITISGGTVKATGKNSGAGIGPGFSEKVVNNTVIITGGTITGLTRGIKGKTVIVGPAAKMPENYNVEYTNGFVFKNNAATVQGYTSLSDGVAFEIPEGNTLTIPEGAGLTIVTTATLTNNGTIKVEGNLEGRVGGTGKVMYKLVDGMVSLDPEGDTYNGEERTVKVKKGTKEFTVGTDYTVAITRNGEKATICDAGTYNVIVTPTVDGALYCDDQDGFKNTFTIAPKALTNDAIDLNPSSFEYTGEEQKPDVTVTLVDGTNLIENTDYKVIYPTDSKDANTYTVTVEGKGNYSGTITKEYTITAKPLTGATVTLSKDEFIYTGEAQQPEVTEVTLDGTTLIKGTDYDVAYPNSIAVGNDYTVTVTGKGNYSGTITGKYAITAKPLTDAMVTLSATEFEYTGEVQKPTVTVTDSEAAITEADYEISCPESKEAGTYTVTVTGQGNYTGTITKSYTIKAKPEPEPEPTPDPDPVPEPDPIYYTITIPETITGAIIEGGGTYTVREYNSITFSIEIDPNGTGQYPTVTRGDQWWSTLTPDRNGTYRVYAYGDTEIRIGEVPGYTHYRLVLPTDSVFENDSTYWSAAGIDLSGMTALGNDIYEAPFGTSVTLSLLPDPHRTFLEWEDGTRQVPRTLLLRDDQEIRALYRKVSPVSNEAIDGLRAYTSGSTLYICTPQKTPALICTPDGRVIFSGEIEGTQRFYGLQPGVYIVQVGDRTFKLTV